MRLLLCEKPWLMMPSCLMSLGEASRKEGLFPSVLVVSRALSGSCLLMLLGSPEFVGRILAGVWEQKIHPRTQRHQADCCWGSSFHSLK